MAPVTVDTFYLNQRLQLDSLSVVTDYNYNCIQRLLEFLNVAVLQRGAGCYFEASFFRCFMNDLIPTRSNAAFIATRKNSGSLMIAHTWHAPTEEQTEQ